MSSRGPRPYRALPEARAMATLRGCVQMAEHGPESRYDFTITDTLPVAFIVIRFAPRILASLRDIETEFHTAILPLRSIASDGSVSRELWLRSKHGTWRFFRIIGEGIVEIGRDGKPLPE
ncbi:hypothetical protein [Methanoregula sp.]|uniref:hypothetical protein n=1 Tax=Methanoregula sp. TaxID=2052170 RepID=UPI00356708F6